MFGADELSQGLCAPRKTGQSGPMFFRIPQLSKGVWAALWGNQVAHGSPQAFRSFRKVYMAGTFGNPRFGFSLERRSWVAAIREGSKPGKTWRFG